MTHVGTLGANTVHIVESGRVGRGGWAGAYSGGAPLRRGRLPCVPVGAADAAVGAQRQDLVELAKTSADYHLN